MDYINDYGLQFGYKLIRHGEVVPFNFFYTSNISIDRELLVAHPFDTTFPSAAWEDIELAYRLDAQGPEDPLQRARGDAALPSDERRLVRAAAVHGRQVGRDLLPRSIPSSATSSACTSSQTRTLGR